MTDEQKPLEPSDEQADELCRAAARVGCEDPLAWPTVMVLWPLIRDYVLEAAAKELEKQEERWDSSWDDPEDRVRAMKGTP